MHRFKPSAATIAIAAFLLIFTSWGRTCNAQASVQTRCEALKTLVLADIPGAATVIGSASVQPAERDLPAFCKIDALIAPQIGFELRLPVAGWNGRFLMQGCGFMCGYFNMEACEDGLIGDYAVVNTDMGHGGGVGSSIWARNQFPLKIDFGYRATHLVAVVSKVIIDKFYGKPPAFSYFRGCSTGGRQAMTEAQRFPEDFDGIISGGSVLNETGDSVYHLVWNGRQTIDAQGRSLIDAKKIPMVHRAVLEACDAQDGMKDGVLSDPLSCHWEPDALACHGGPDSSCLTPVEVDIIKKIYRGNVDGRGNKRYPGGMMRGSELEWVPLFIGVDGQLPNYLQSGMAAVFRYVFLPEDPGPQFSLVTVDLEKLAPLTEIVEPLYDAQNPDLTAFRNHGGKLLMYHGWDDAEIPPGVSIDYYGKAAAVMGGADKTREFFRLFMIPGMAHCRRGPGADAIDYLAAMVAWVEQGKAPDALLASHMKVQQPYNGIPVLRFPLAAQSVAWTRPVYPYPERAVWSGTGDWTDATTWRASAKP